LPVSSGPFFWKKG